jgi:hypothetical protein
LPRPRTSVSPAVVNITTSAVVAEAHRWCGADLRAGRHRLPEGSPFQDFFDDFMNDPDGRPEEGDFGEPQRHRRSGRAL